jgi:F-type H+-transporting ATPase subunit a
VKKVAKEQIIDFAPTEVFGFVVNAQTICMSWLTMIVVAALLFIVTRKPQLVPGKFQLCVETAFELVASLVKGNLGEAGYRVAGSFFLTLFLYIFIGNEIGLLPQIFTPLHLHITSPTNDINTTLALGLTTMGTIITIGVRRKGVGYFRHFFQPSWMMFPLNLLDEVVKPFVMAFRLFGNIVAGEILLLVLYQLVPWVLPEIWVGFSLAVGLVQALIFTILSICYMRGAFEEHH